MVESSVVEGKCFFLSVLKVVLFRKKKGANFKLDPELASSMEASGFTLIL